MKKEFLEKQTKVLNAQREEILKNLEAQDAELFKMVGNSESGDEVDIASDAIDRKLINELGAQNANRLNQIDEALTRIKRGTYGICLNCGEPIKLGRLEALPWTTLCVDCQADAEKHSF